ncbi:hypothetical protein GGE09_002536 [Roseobacter sp. N2S]|nr:hypothetical protein [Roseobacter sp. N2S]
MMWSKDGESPMSYKTDIKAKKTCGKQTPLTF